MKKVKRQSQDRVAPETPSHLERREEVRFDGLRSAITPINLMFDGKLFRDLKSLTAHVVAATKKVTAERPDYQGALSEINQLEATFRAAVDQWERKLTGEIQRLKTAIETQPDKSLGATKKISKYQAELHSGRGSVTSMPSKISQVRHQLTALCGDVPHLQAAAVAPMEGGVRFSQQKRDFPVVYRSCVRQIIRKATKLDHHKKFHELALAVFKNVSKPVRELGARQIHEGVLYYLHETAACTESTDDVVRQKAQFVVATGMNQTGTAYVFQTVFPEIEQVFEISCEDFELRAVDVLEPQENTEIISTLLMKRFQDDDFKATFNLYHRLRQKALEDGRDEKFNPKQQAIHNYLTGPIFEFVGIAYDRPADEIRLVGEVNERLHRVVETRRERTH